MNNPHIINVTLFTHYKEHNVQYITAVNQDVACQRLWLEGEQFPA